MQLDTLKDTVSKSGKNFQSFSDRIRSVPQTRQADGFKENITLKILWKLISDMPRDSLKILAICLFSE